MAYAEAPGPWAQHAACKNQTETMFPDETDRQAVAAAKAICARCDVRAECLEWALVNVEKYGVLGGYVERQRRKMRSARQLRARRAPMKHGEPHSWARCARTNGEACALCRDAHTRWVGTREQRGAA